MDDLMELVEKGSYRVIYVNPCSISAIFVENGDTVIIVGNEKRFVINMNMHALITRMRN